MARILGPELFGEFGIVRSTINLFAVYAGFRLGSTATKYIAEFGKKDPVKASRILHLTLKMSLVFCGFTAVFMFFAAPVLAEKTLNRISLIPSLRIGAFFLFFSAYGLVRESALIGFERFQIVTKLYIIKGVLTLLFCVPFCYYWSVEGAIAALCVTEIIIFSLTAISLKKECIKAKLPLNIQFNDAKSEISVLWTFALPGLLVGILDSTTMWAGRVILSNYKTGFTEVGMYEAANQWRTMILFLPAVLTRVSLPILSELDGSGKKNDFKKAVIFQLKTINNIALPLTLLIIISSKLISAIYGDAFSGLHKVLPVLMASVYFSSINQTLRKVYDSLGKRWTNFFMFLLWAVVFLLVSVKMINDWGALGLAFGYLMAELSLFCIQILHVEFFIVPGILRSTALLFIISFASISLVILSQYYWLGF